MTFLFRAKARWLMLLVLLTAGMTAPVIARAHFSYSDPRIIHVVENGKGGAAILMRLPAPLALLPDDWQGQAETRLPPFATLSEGVEMLDPARLDLSNAGLNADLARSLTITANGEVIRPEVRAFRIYSDADRPRFGTARTAQKAFDKAATAPVPYFDATLDIQLTVPGNLKGDLRLTSALGAQFRVIDRFGTVVKLHRAGGTETKATIGTLDVGFPAVATRLDILRDAAFSGAEHIYRGPDHLALILLIALAASGWRQALGWASAFTIGHVITLAAGLYGVAPSAGWFVPLVELGIALSIVAAGVAVFAQRRNAFGWLGLFVVGLIHGYGFAASAATAQFAGAFDPMMLLSFAAGLELCQFALYAAILPAILLTDRLLPATVVTWRRSVALGIALLAVSATLSRLGDASGAFGIA